MVDYEVVYLLRDDLSEDAVKKVNEKLQGVLAKHNAARVDLKDLGKKPLAYRIKKQTKGHYFLLEYQGIGGVSDELERNLRLSEQVLRFLTIRKPKVSTKYAAKGEKKHEA